MKRLTVNGKVVDARVVRRTGPAIWDRVHFECKSDLELSKTDIYDIQIKLGYHPCGYDGPWGLVVDNCVYTWNCSASCD